MTRHTDIAPAGRALTEETKLRHEFWKESNTNLIRAAGFAFDVLKDGEVLAFRAEGKPSVNFNTTTGRWIALANGRIHTGGAQAFIRWYREAR